MSVRIRLKRIGMTKQPYYRLVAIDRRSARGGAEIEVLGHYNPRIKEKNFDANEERVQYWISCGAEVSETTRSLLKKNGYFQKKPKAEEPKA